MNENNDAVRAAREQALEAAAKIIESFCAVGEDMDQDGMDLVLHQRAQRIRGLKSQPAAGSSPVQAVDCCDTPNYCSAARRCTAKDAAPTEPAQQSGYVRSDEPISEQNARFAIDAVIAYGRMGTNKPADDHWLMEYWQIGQQLAKLGETSAWDNVTPADQQAAGESIDTPEFHALAMNWYRAGTYDTSDEGDDDAAWAALIAYIDSRRPAAAPTDLHADDIAVDSFAAAMKAKMAQSRAKGRGGWEDPAQCPAERLQAMLCDHVSKGDPVDVGNFAMMLFNRGERAAITATPTANQLIVQLHDNEKWTVAEQNQFAVFLQQYPDESSRGIEALGSAWKYGKVCAAAIASARPSAAPEVIRLKVDYTVDSERGWIEVFGEEFTIECAKGHRFAIHNSLECVGEYTATHIATGFAVGRGETPEAAIELARTHWATCDPESLSLKLMRAKNLTKKNRDRIGGTFRLRPAPDRSAT